MSLGSIDDENVISFPWNLLLLLLAKFFGLSPAERIASLNGRGSLFLMILGRLRGDIPLYSDRAVPYRRGKPYDRRESSLCRLKLFILY